MYETWQELENSIKECNKCKLCTTRKNIVFGTGNKNSKIMFIGEGPGADEDMQGEPFVGKAGQLMNKCLEALEIERNDVYIANIVKCRPPQNRNPEKDEVEACMDYLRNQVILLKPKIIVLLRKCSFKECFRWRVWYNKFTRKMDRKKRNFIYANFSPSSTFTWRIKKNRFLDGFKTSKI